MRMVSVVASLALFPLVVMMGLVKFLAYCAGGFSLVSLGLLYLATNKLRWTLFSQFSDAVLDMMVYMLGILLPLNAELQGATRENGR